MESVSRIYSHLIVFLQSYSPLYLTLHNDEKDGRADVYQYQVNLQPFGRYPVTSAGKSSSLVWIKIKDLAFDQEKQNIGPE